MPKDITTLDYKISMAKNQDEEDKIIREEIHDDVDACQDKL